ncbi:MAG: aspartate aminotransferase family protein [Solirubrobacterales bacterium]|nr:aspartate aminotransferase family protein [Solirubrobacterales bacterium]
MTGNNGAGSPAGTDAMQEMAKRHLMLHFTDMSAFNEYDMTIIERGEGVYVYDRQGNRLIDGLSGLYCTSLGHSYGDEVGEVAHEQLKRLPFSSNWTVAHPPSIELAARIADLAPDGMNRVFFTSGGSESVESAWKMAVQWQQARGEPRRRKVIARKNAYHGVTMGALSFTGIPVCRTPFDPLGIPAVHVSNTGAYRHPEGHDEAAHCAALLAEIEQTIEFEDASTIAMMIAEPVQNAGGCFTPPAGYWQGLREICDRHGILLCSDEVICAYGRIGEWFGGQRFGFVPDLVTFAKGLTAAHFSMGGVLMHDRVAEPFLDGTTDYNNGLTFGGHPVGCAVALKSLEIMERDGVLENVRANEPAVDRALNGLRDIPIVGDVRGMGYFWAIELVRDQQTREPFSGSDAERLMSDVLSTALYERGLICRLDDRADPIVQIAPPLVSEPELFTEIAGILREGFEIAADHVGETITTG